MARQEVAARGRAIGAAEGEAAEQGDEPQALAGLASRREETDGLDRVAARPAVGASLNVVHLVGRLGATAQERTLPSGDAVLTFYVVVDRGATGHGSVRPRPGRGRPGSGGGGDGVDALACAAWSPRARRTVRALDPGMWIEVEGALRRRFRRGAVPPVSFYEVEVARVRRVR